MIDQGRALACGLYTPPRPLTLQAAELPGTVLPRDVLPVGAAGQGHHGAQGGGPLAHLHLELHPRGERSVSVPRGLEKAWQRTGAPGVRTSEQLGAPLRASPPGGLSYSLLLTWQQPFLPSWQQPVHFPSENLPPAGSAPSIWLQGADDLTTDSRHGSVT